MPNKRKLLGYCGVDSGQILLTDPCYLNDWKADESQGKGQEKDLLTTTEGYHYSYSGACAATLSDDQGGQLRYPMGHAGAGVAVSSGWGDGNYPVYANYGKDGRISSVTIKF